MTLGDSQLVMRAAIGVFAALVVLALAVATIIIVILIRR